MDSFYGARSDQNEPSLETLADLASARLTGPVRATGLTVLYQPSQPYLDVAFVHGITGHPEWTWTYKGDENATSYEIEEDDDDTALGCENDDDSHSNDSYDQDAYLFFGPPRKTQKSDVNSRPHRVLEEPSRIVYWPRDLISDTAPYARICTYGYDTNLRQVDTGTTSQNTLCDIAWELLVSLEVARRSAPTRPVMFIAHSLGGVVIQEMLRRSRACQSDQPDLFQIFKSTVGIMFFGTPHGGADPRGYLQRVSESIGRVSKLRLNEEAIRDLLPSSDRLRRLRDEFREMASTQRWKIHSFQEELGLEDLKGDKVVKDDFSHLNCPAIEVKQYIEASHMNMCRFTGMDDPEYRKVAAGLYRIARSTIEKLMKTGAVVGKKDSPFRNHEARFVLSEEQKRSLLDSLRFDQMEVRQMSIKTAYAETCSWLTKKKEYVDWADENKFEQHRGFLWIKGKPGTGKSVLMKYALGNLRNTALDRTQICFFFNARGSKLERTTLGMYRTLLVQLYEKLPRLQLAFGALGLSPTVTFAWSIEALKDLFERTIRLLGSRPVVCCIDALDECEESQVRDMIEFFQRLGDVAAATKVRFWVLFTSRHYPHITINKGLHLVLESQKGHEQDISEYIENMSTIGNGERARKLKKNMRAKASGVFMWVVLVVGILNKEHDEGRTMRRLQKTLSAIPGDLHELFRDIITRDTRNKDELLLCLQWLLFTARPLRPEELYFAIVSGTDPDEILPWDIEEIPMESIIKFILNSSKGLVECTSSDQPTVQFIHESVRDFLLKDGLKTVWPDLGVNFQGQSHDTLTRCCRRYLDNDVMTALNFPSHSELSRQQHAEIRQTATQKFPFLDYSVRNIFCHSDFAEIGNTDQEKFLNDLPLVNWIQLYNMIHGGKVFIDIIQGGKIFRPYSSHASLFYVLAERNTTCLIRRHFTASCCFQVEDEQYGAPILAALATGNNELITTMLAAQAASQPFDPFLDNILRPYKNQTKQYTRIKRGFCFDEDDGILRTIAYQGDEVIFAFYLAANKNLDEQDHFGRTLLSYAAERGYQAVAKRLLATKLVSADSKSREGRTSLSYAAEQGHVSIVRMLIGEDGVGPDSSSDFKRTPLSYAAEKGHEQIIAILLAEGVDPDSKEALSNRTPLRYATEHGHAGVVQMLLSTDVDVDSKDSESEQTCLLWAAQHQNESIVKLLLDKNADVEAITPTGRTALALAAENGNGEIVGLLLDKGADVNKLDKSKWSPLLLAAKAGHDVVLRLLIERNGDIEATDGDFGRSPLSWAAGYGHTAAVRFLLEKGANTESRDKYGRTPSDCANSQGQRETLWELMFAPKKR